MKLLVALLLMSFLLLGSVMAQSLGVCVNASIDVSPATVTLGDPIIVTAAVTNCGRKLTQVRIYAIVEKTDPYSSTQIFDVTGVTIEPDATATVSGQYTPTLTGNYDAYIIVVYHGIALAQAEAEFTVQ